MLPVAVSQNGRCPNVQALVLKKTKSVCPHKNWKNSFPKSALQVESYIYYNIYYNSLLSPVSKIPIQSMVECGYMDVECPITGGSWEVLLQYIVDHHIVTFSETGPAGAPVHLANRFLSFDSLIIVCHVKHKEQHVCVRTWAQGCSPRWQVYTKEPCNKTNTAERLLVLGDIFRCGASLLFHTCRLTYVVLRTDLWLTSGQCANGAQNRSFWTLLVLWLSELSRTLADLLILWILSYLVTYDQNLNKANKVLAFQCKVRYSQTPVVQLSSRWSHRRTRALCKQGSDWWLEDSWGGLSWLKRLSFWTTLQNHIYHIYAGSLEQAHLPLFDQCEPRRARGSRVGLLLTLFRHLNFKYPALICPPVLLTNPTLHIPICFYVLMIYGHTAFVYMSCQNLLKSTSSLLLL